MTGPPVLVDALERVPVLSDVTAVIKTFRRPACLAAAVEHLHQWWPAVAAVIVLDDGPPELQVPPDPRYRLILTEEDIGLSEGRNRLVDAVETPLVAVFDDDFVAGSAARLDLLAGLVSQGCCDLVGTAVREAKGFWNGGWVYRRKGRELHKLHAAHERAQVDVGGELVDLFRVDQVNNAFVARTDFVRRVRWDPRLKLREHDDFALRSSGAGRIAYTPGSIVDHRPHDPPGYREIREDTHRYHEYFLAKWGLSEIVKAPDWGVHAPSPPLPPVLT